MESLLLAVGEELHVRIGVQEYHLVDKADDHCNASLDHSYEEGSTVLTVHITTGITSTLI
jgi:hypothetical protein